MHIVILHLPIGCREGDRQAPYRVSGLCPQEPEERGGRAAENEAYQHREAIRGRPMSTYCRKQRIYQQSETTFQKVII